MDPKFPSLKNPPMDSKLQQQPKRFHPKVMRSSSTNSDATSNFESPHSPLGLHSHLQSDRGAPPEPDETPYTSASATPLAYTQYSPASASATPLAFVDAYTQYSPAAALTPAAATKGRSSIGGGGSMIIGVSGYPKKSKAEDVLNMSALGFRLSEVILCLISFSVMAADKTQGWSGDSYDRYIEYRYCLCVNVIGFAYSGFQALDVAYYLITRNHLIRHHLRYPFNFFTDQILAYLLISASSASASRAIDWESNWGKDEFTQMASVSVAMALLAFAAFAVSSLISGYNLSSHISPPTPSQPMA